MTHRIVTYNLLSSRLARPDYFTSCQPRDLKSKVRLPKILDALTGEVARGSILCLQEVSTSWAGELHSFFAAHDYHLITALYAGRKSGYMGVATAIPRARYSLETVRIERLSDGRDWSWLRHWTVTARNWAHAITRRMTSRIHLEHPQFFAQRRFNQLIFTRLQDRQTRVSFCVGNYHMPCVFFVGQVMTIHLAMLMQRMQSLAGACPLIVTGDFNIRPGTDHYNLIATGKMSNESPDYPACLPRDPWRPDLPRGYRSAYAEVLGREPAFTNYAQVRNAPPFCDTLDYIWLSPEWTAKSVRPLPSREEVGSPLPNENYPSDHLLLAADVELPDPDQTDVRNQPDSRISV